MPTPTRLLLSLALVLPLVLIGCATQSAGPVPVEVAPPGEASAPRQLSTTVLTEFSRLIVEDLIRALPEAPGAGAGVGETGGPVVVLLGGVTDKTGRAPTAEDAYVVSGVRHRLVRSRQGQGGLVFVERRNRLTHPAPHGPAAAAPVRLEDGRLSWNGGTYSVPGYDAANTFVLSMETDRVGGGDTGRYTMQLRLDSLAARQAVFTRRYEMKPVGE